MVGCVTVRPRLWIRSATGDAGLRSGNVVDRSPVHQIRRLPVREVSRRSLGGHRRWTFQWPERFLISLLAVLDQRISLSDHSFRFKPSFLSFHRQLLALGKQLLTFFDHVVAVLPSLAE